tara:strand:- start:70 stop:360 length:291 start_codon:yes stop_codon:yes gene_type:complete
MKIEKMIIGATQKGTIEAWIPKEGRYIDLGSTPDSIADFFSTVVSLDSVSHSSSCEFATELNHAIGEPWDYDTEPLDLFDKGWQVYLSRIARAKSF